MVAGDQLTHGLHPDICGDHPEADGDQAIGAPFRRLRRMPLLAEPPEQDDAGDGLDHGVGAESDQGDRARGEPGGNGDGGFDRMPPEPEASKTLGASDELWTPGLRAGGKEGEGC